MPRNSGSTAPAYEFVGHLLDAEPCDDCATPTRRLYKVIENGIDVPLCQPCADRRNA